MKEFNDDDFAQIFIDIFEKNIKEIYKKFKFPKSMIMTMQDKMAYVNSTLCHICNEELGDDRVSTLLFVTSLMKNSVTTESVIIVICLVSLEVLLMKSAT